MVFVAALLFAACLPAGRAAEALRTRRNALEQRITGLDDALALIPKTLPRLLLIETEYERNRLDAERSCSTAR